MWSDCDLLLAPFKSVIGGRPQKSWWCKDYYLVQIKDAFIFFYKDFLTQMTLCNRK